MDRTTDRAVMALLLGGVALATVTALYLPALHVRSADRALLGLSSWQVVPVTTLLLFAALAAALAVHWVPRWRHLRLPVTVAAIVMLFVPPLAALAAGVSPGTEARALLVRHSGNAAPWVDPAGAPWCCWRPGASSASGSGGRSIRPGRRRRPSTRAMSPAGGAGVAGR